MPNAPQQLGCTCFKMRKITRALSRLYDHHMATVGLKTTQYSVLAHANRAAMPMAELAEELGLERTTLTRNLKPLADAGWIELLPGADSRQRVVTITASGRAKVREAYQAWQAAEAQFTSTIGPDALQSLHRQLDDTMTRVTPLIEELSNADPD